MQFESPAQKECFERILPWMKDIFGEMFGTHKEIPSFLVTAGSAQVTVTIWPWGDDDATITVRAYVITGAEITPELMKFLLNQNSQMRFGAFGVDDDNDIFFAHTIVGATVDKEELKASIMAVGITADLLDDKISEKWGGQRAVDRG